MLKRARHYFYISARECIATLQPRPPSRPEGRLCHLTVADGQQSVLSWVSEIRRTTFSTALETYPILSSLVPPNLLINPGSRFLYLLQVFILKDVFEAICLLYIFHLPIIYTHIYILLFLRPFFPSLPLIPSNIFQSNTFESAKQMDIIDNSLSNIPLTFSQDNSEQPVPGSSPACPIIIPPPVSPLPVSNWEQAQTSNYLSLPSEESFAWPSLWFEVPSLSPQLVPTSGSAPPDTTNSMYPLPLDSLPDLIRTSPFI